MAEPDKKPEPAKEADKPVAAKKELSQAEIKQTFTEAMAADKVIPVKLTQPPAAKEAAADPLVVVDQVVFDHLKFIATFPPGSMAVIDFRDKFDLGVNAVLVLKTYEQDGLLQTRWVGSANRYSLTEVGLLKIS